MNTTFTDFSAAVDSSALRDDLQDKMLSSASVHKHNMDARPVRDCMKLSPRSRQWIAEVDDYAKRLVAQTLAFKLYRSSSDKSIPGSKLPAFACARVRISPGESCLYNPREEPWRGRL